MTAILPVFEFSELSKEAQKAAVIRFQDENYFGYYAEHERAEYAASRKKFECAVTSVLAHAKNSSIQDLVFKLAEVLDGNYFKDLGKNKPSISVTTTDDAIRAFDQCHITGVCTDYYLIDPLKAYLNGSITVNGSFWDLIVLVKQKADKAFKKQCQYFKTQEFIREVAMENGCDDLWFFSNGKMVSGSLLEHIQRA